MNSKTKLALLGLIIISLLAGFSLITHEGGLASSCRKMPF